MVLGYPLGPADYVNKQLESVRDSIKSELACLHALDDGLIHFHLLQMCTNARFAYNLRASLPQATTPVCREIDNLIWTAFQ